MPPRLVPPVAHLNLVAELARHFEAACTDSRPVTLADVDARPLGTRLRDGFFWLFSPFL